MSITPGEWRQVPWPDRETAIVVGEPAVDLFIARVYSPAGSDDANVICAAKKLLAACEVFNIMRWRSGDPADDVLLRHGWDGQENRYVFADRITREAIALATSAAGGEGE